MPFSNHKQESSLNSQIEQATSLAPGTSALRNISTIPLVEPPDTIADSASIDVQQDRSTPKSTWKPEDAQRDASQHPLQVEKNGSRQVVSVAYRKASQMSTDVPRMIPSANKLDDELDMPMTPTQKKILGMTEDTGAINIFRTDGAASSTLGSCQPKYQNDSRPAQTLSSASTVKRNSVSQPIALTKPGPNSRDVFAGEKYSSMSFYDAMQKEYEMIAKSRIENYHNVPDSGTLGKHV